MADNRLWIQIKNHPETRFLLAKELATNWWCPDENLTISLEEWLKTHLGYGVYEDLDIASAEDIEIITENSHNYTAFSKADS